MRDQLDNVIRVLRYEFAAEGAGEDALFKAIEEGQRAGRFSLDEPRHGVLSLNTHGNRLLFCN